MNDRNQLDDPRRYAAAVRAALADLGEPERAALLDDLEAHLAEVAAESEAPLTQRLGPPERYAAELRGAYDAGGQREPRALRALSRPGRRWQLAYLALVALVIVGAAILGLVAWRSSASDHWTYAQLVDRARAGEVRSVEITGTTAIVSERSGARHSVDVGSNSENLAGELTRDNVDVVYRSSGGWAATWTGLLLVLAPNLLLLLLIAALGTGLYLALRRPGASPGTTG